MTKEEEIELISSLYPWMRTMMFVCDNIVMFGIGLSCTIGGSAIAGVCFFHHTYPSICGMAVLLAAAGTALSVFIVLNVRDWMLKAD